MKTTFKTFLFVVAVATWALLAATARAFGRGESK